MKKKSDHARLSELRQLLDIVDSFITFMRTPRRGSADEIEQANALIAKAEQERDRLVREIEEASIPVN